MLNSFTLHDFISMEINLIIKSVDKTYCLQQKARNSSIYNSDQRKDIVLSLEKNQGIVVSESKRRKHFKNDHIFNILE